MNKFNNDESKKVSKKIYTQIMLCGVINLSIYYAIVYHNFTNLGLNQISDEYSANTQESFVIWPCVTFLIFIISTILAIFPQLLTLSSKATPKEKEKNQETYKGMFHSTRNTLTSFLAIASWFLVYKQFDDFKYSTILFLSAALCIAYTFKKIIELNKMILATKE